MLASLWSRIVAGIFSALAILAPLSAAIREALVGAAPREVAYEPIAPPHLADIAETALADAPVLNAAVEQAPPPPPALMPLAMRMVQARPPQEDEFWHPSWAGNGTGLMPMFTGHYAAAAAAT
jgi:hypothetical protein